MSTAAAGTDDPCARRLVLEVGDRVRFSSGLALTVLRERYDGDRYRFLLEWEDGDRRRHTHACEPGFLLGHGASLAILSERWDSAGRPVALVVRVVAESPADLAAILGGAP